MIVNSQIPLRKSLLSGAANAAAGVKRENALYLFNTVRRNAADETGHTTVNWSAAPQYTSKVLLAVVSVCIYIMAS